MQIPRLEALQNVSEHYNSDPYSLSVKVRKKFRQEKKIEQQKRKADDDIKGRYGLPVSLSLLEDDEKAKEEAKSAWEEARQQVQLREATKRRRVGGVDVPLVSTSQARIGSSTGSKTSLDTLRARVLENTARKTGGLAQSRLPTSKPALPIRKI